MFDTTENEITLDTAAEATEAAEATRRFAHIVEVLTKVTGHVVA
ncbi:hypothetical protein [Burkholderia multivorans]|jgi:hypothetical protein|nr:hypothetical protein [Burkholderia multivorans]MDN8078722.1 hypothetical protein [Burkholderia multivorans]